MIRYQFHAVCLILCLLRAQVALAEPPASGKSNLSLGRSGWDVVSGQMRDNGDNNE